MITNLALGAHGSYKCPETQRKINPWPLSGLPWPHPIYIRTRRDHGPRSCPGPAACGASVARGCFLTGIKIASQPLITAPTLLNGQPRSCGEPTIAPVNAGRLCHRCGARLDASAGKELTSVYDLSVGAAETPSKGPVKMTSSSGRSPTSPEERQALLESYGIVPPPASRIRAAEQQVADCETDLQEATDELRAALSVLPFEATRRAGEVLMLDQVVA